MKTVSRRFALAAVFCLSVAVAGCTQMPQNGEVDRFQAADPLEPINRGIYGFNRVVDGLILRPAAVIYQGIVPEQGRTMVSNFLENLYTPVVFANSVLQADADNSFASFFRFVINSTAGIGGLFDVADEIPLKNRHTDFGQTLAIYGADTGPYLVLPIIGPSNVRDAIGRLADALMNPFNYLEEPWPYVIWGATAVDQRSQNMKLIDDVNNSSLDPYATFRSGYIQKRAADVKRAKEERAKSLENIKSQ